MPLHDHFHPPWSIRRPWEGFHSAWATSIAYHLNSGLLPTDYYAMPLIQPDGRVEVDVAGFQDSTAPSLANGPESNPHPWIAPAPLLTLPLGLADGESFEIQILRNIGGPQLRAAIELISPGNKDRPAARRAFAVKCASYLRRGVSVFTVDVVTDRKANLHAEILQSLGESSAGAWNSTTDLSAISYRGVVGIEEPRLEIWPAELLLGAPLPELPLWLDIGLSVPLRLEESYRVTCSSLRM